MDTDFYALLGIERNATDDQIKKAYRKLARELHPDANPNDPEAEERFKQVSLAYEVLRDPERRQKYDQFGIDGIRGTGSGGGGAGDPFGFGDVNLGDLFDAFFGGSPFGGARKTGGSPAGADMQANIRVGFETAVFGGEAEVTLKLPVPCDVCDATGAAPGTQAATCADCQGQGEVRRVRQSILGQVVTSAACQRCHGTGQEISSPCPTCHGEGRRTMERSFTVEVPAGIDNGQTLRLPGKGAAGPRGGQAGDLYINVAVESHPQFVRRGFDLIHELHIPVTQAALGARVELTTLDGKEEIVIHPGTQTGKVEQFKGRGVPHVSGRGRGDLIVAVVVDTPTNLSKDQEELLRSFAAERSEKVGDGEHGLLGKIKGAFK